MPILVEKLTPTAIDDIEGPETSSKRRLIAAGERLMGLHGIDGPKLHDVAAEAGQANKYAVQYHFGGRGGLVDAIFTMRLRWIDQRRKSLHLMAKQRGLLGDLRCLFEIIFVPMSEQIDGQGRHSYARFLLQYLSRIGFDPVHDAPYNSPNKLLRQTVERIAKVTGHAYPAVEIRFYQQNFVMLAGLAARDIMAFRCEDAVPLERVLDDAIVMICPALMAPLALTDTDLAFAPNRN